MSKGFKKKIIWALDPNGDAKVQLSSAIFAKILNKIAEIEIVYSYAQPQLFVEPDKNVIREEFSEIEEKIAKMLKIFEFPLQKPPTILTHNSPLVSMDVETLVNYAKKRNVDAILASSNAKKGFIQAALGSFAESLILESSVPVIIVNSKSKVESQPGTILFPTDFSSLSWKAFHKLIGFAQETKASIRIFHQIQEEKHSISQNAKFFADEMWLESDCELDDSIKDLKENLKKWLDFAKKEQVKCNHVIKIGPRNITDATLELAKKEHPWMIAVPSMTGPIASAFIGSNARWIVRRAHCPVWALYIQGE